jgi:hypothetical protein
MPLNDGHTISPTSLGGGEEGESTARWRKRGRGSKERSAPSSSIVEKMETTDFGLGPGVWILWLAPFHSTVYKVPTSQLTLPRTWRGMKCHGNIARWQTLCNARILSPSRYDAAFSIRADKTGQDAGRQRGHFVHWRVGVLPSHPRADAGCCAWMGTEERLRVEREERGVFSLRHCDTPIPLAPWSVVLIAHGSCW